MDPFSTNEELSVQGGDMPAPGEQGLLDSKVMESADDFGSGEDFTGGMQQDPFGGMSEHQPYEEVGYSTLDAPQDVTEPEPKPPTALDEFNEKWEMELMKKREEEDKTVAQQKKQADEDREKFMDEKGKKVEAKMKQNRSEEQVLLEQLEADLESENSWERVTKLVDLQTDGTEGAADVSRMRSIIIQLKNEPLEVSRQRQH